MSSKNWASHDAGAELVDCSSETVGCEAVHVLDPSLEKIWLSDQGLPQWMSIDLGGINDNKSLVIRTVGWNCWHSFKTNPKEMRIHVSSDGNKYKVWDTFQARVGPGTQLFDCAPISIALYPYVAFEIVETFGGTNTYMNRVYLYSDEIPSSPFEATTPSSNNNAMPREDSSRHSPESRENYENPRSSRNDIMGNLGIIESLKYTPHVDKTMSSLVGEPKLIAAAAYSTNESESLNRHYFGESAPGDRDRNYYPNPTSDEGLTTSGLHRGGGGVGGNCPLSSEDDFLNFHDLAGSSDFPVSRSIQNLRKLYLGRESLQDKTSTSQVSRSFGDGINNFNDNSNYNNYSSNDSNYKNITNNSSNSRNNNNNNSNSNDMNDIHRRSSDPKSKKVNESLTSKVLHPNIIDTSSHDSGLDSDFMIRIESSSQPVITTSRNDRNPLENKSKELDSDDVSIAATLEHDKLRRILIDQVVELEGLIDGEEGVNTELVSPKMIKLAKQLNESIANRETILKKLLKIKQYKVEICKKYDFLKGALL